jgi:hypothetical protein
MATEKHTKNAPPKNKNTVRAAALHNTASTYVGTGNVRHDVLNGGGGVLYTRERISSPKVSEVKIIIQI